jgi:HK97 family phage major capsid protein
MTFAEIMDKKQALMERSKSAKTIEELKKIKEDMAALNDELSKLNQEQEMERMRAEIADSMSRGEYKGKPLGGVDVPNTKVDKKDFASTPEYRKAFMEFFRTGEMPAMFRDVAMTSGNSAVIPVPILNEIVQKMEKYGNVLPLVRHLSYPAGMIVPTSTLSAKATWTTEGDKIPVNGKTTTPLTFSAYQLSAAVGISFQAQVKSMAIFEASLAKDVAQAMTQTLEEAIISGDGSGKPTGITKATPAATLTLPTSLSYKFITQIMKAIPSAYQTGTKLFMNEASFMDFAGLTDTAGQPIAHVNYGLESAPNAVLLGKPVVFTDFLPSLDTVAAKGTAIFAIDPSKYILNTSYDMDMVTYVDNETRNRVYQSVGMYDGKVVDANGLVLINKAGA